MFLLRCEAQLRIEKTTGLSFGSLGRVKSSRGEKKGLLGSNNRTNLTRESERSPRATAGSVSASLPPKGRTSICTSAAPQSISARLWQAVPLDPVYAGSHTYHTHACVCVQESATMNSGGVINSSVTCWMRAAQPEAAADVKRADSGVTAATTADPPTVETDQLIDKTHTHTHRCKDNQPTTHGCCQGSARAN